jgi:cell division protein FtsW
MGRTNQKLAAPDFPLFLLAIVLVCVGLIMVYSASAIMAEDKFGNSMHFVLRQVAWLAVGIPVMWAVSRMDLEKYRAYAVPALFVGIFLMALVLVPGLGTRVGVAKRWFRLGPFSFQPSEAFKLVMVFFLADSLVRRCERIQTFRGIMPYMVVLAICMGILQLQHDLGSIITLIALTMGLLYLAGVRKGFFALPAVALVAAVAYLVMSSSYRVRRWNSFLHPWEDPQGAGFQLIQSLIAVGSGGPLGVGLSNSTQKLFYLPAPHTDFIYAIIGEELGLWGTMGILILFVLFAVRGFQVASEAARRPDGRFDALLAAGLTVLIVFQAFFNMGVVTGLLPTKGLPLPLVSYGGTSLVFSLAAVGLLLNVSRRSRLNGMKG